MRSPFEIRIAVERAFAEHTLIDYASAEIERLEGKLAEAKRENLALYDKGYRNGKRHGVIEGGDEQREYAGQSAETIANLRAHASEVSHLLERAGNIIGANEEVSYDDFCAEIDEALAKCGDCGALWFQAHDPSCPAWTAEIQMGLVTHPAPGVEIHDIRSDFNACQHREYCRGIEKALNMVTRPESLPAIPSEKCETCKGTGWIITSYPNGPEFECSCPDCKDGTRELLDAAPHVVIVHQYCATHKHLEKPMTFEAVTTTVANIFCPVCAAENAVISETKGEKHGS